MPEILGEESDLLVKRFSDFLWGVLQCGNDPGMSVIDLIEIGV
jgi:hypothetical protein